MLTAQQNIYNARRMKAEGNRVTIAKTKENENKPNY